MARALVGKTAGSRWLLQKMRNPHRARRPFLRTLRRGTRIEQARPLRRSAATFRVSYPMVAKAGKVLSSQTENTVICPVVIATPRTTIVAPAAI